jgi:hypothetical protein
MQHTSPTSSTTHMLPIATEHRSNKVGLLLLLLLLLLLSS